MSQLRFFSIAVALLWGATVFAMEKTKDSLKNLEKVEKAGGAPAEAPCQKENENENEKEKKERGMEFIGHRGASEDAPENTLSSVKLAYEQGADGAEIDIQLTKDKKIILMHDDNAKRTGGEDKNIIDMTSDELASMDVGKWKDEKWKGEKVSFLDEVVKVIPKGKKLFVEIKGGDHQIIDPLVEILKGAASRPEQIKIISFDHGVLKELKKKAPQYEIYFLTTYRFYPGTWPYMRNEEELQALMKAAKEAGASGFDIEYAPNVTKELVKKLKDNGFKVAVWSYAEDDNVEAMEKMSQVGLDFFTTDRPKLMKEKFLKGSLQGK